MMKVFAMLLIGLFVTPVSSQEVNMGNITVRDIQGMYEAESDKDEIQKTFQVFFNGYGIGFVAGTQVAL